MMNLTIANKSYRKFYQFVTWLIIVIGIIHLIVAFFKYDKLIPDAIWFASAGLALIFAGFLNLAFLNHVTPLNKLISEIANIALAILVALLVMMEPALDKKFVW